MKLSLFGALHRLTWWCTGPYFNDGVIQLNNLREDRERRLAEISHQKSLFTQNVTQGQSLLQSLGHRVRSNRHPPVRTELTVVFSIPSRWWDLPRQCMRLRQLLRPCTIPQWIRARRGCRFTSSPPHQSWRTLLAECRQRLTVGSTVLLGERFLLCVCV
jgi:hypothetical protein